MRASASALAAIAALALMPAPARAQAAATAGTGVSFQSYWFRDPAAARIRSLSLLALPLAARVNVGAGVRVDVSGAWARGRLERDDGSAATIAGFTDTQVSVSVPVPGDVLTLSGIVSLPTGIESASMAQAEVAGAIASDLLPFRVYNWGTGGGAGLGASLSQAVGEVALGAGASYVVAREFAPLADPALAAYRPGDQLNVQLAASRNYGQTARLSVQLGYQHQSADHLAGNNLFRSGDRFQAIGSYAFRVGRASSGIVYAGGQQRQHGSALLDITVDAPAQTLILFGGGLRRPWGTGVLSPSADFRVLRSQDGLAQGYTASLGSSGEWPVGRVKLGPQLRVHAGRVLVRQGSETMFGGAELALGCHF